MHKCLEIFAALRSRRWLLPVHEVQHNYVVPVQGSGIEKVGVFDHTDFELGVFAEHIGKCGGCLPPVVTGNIHPGNN
jgi:hypothetical protein